MGATLTAVFLLGTALHIAEVGDSRAYLLRNGEMVQVTRDQSYVQMLVDLGHLTTAEAEVAPQKNIILQAMGQETWLRVALGRLELRQRDCFLDLFRRLPRNELSDDEIRKVILAAPRMDAACASLIDLARQHGGRDNITVLLGGVSGDLPPVSAGEAIADTLEILKEYVAPPPGRSQEPPSGHGTATR